jgi:peptidoglycan/xylan/chitin deacetylase (PgdA/CDA1 family)
MIEALHAAGYGYDSSFGDDDVPYWLRVAPGSEAEMIQLPWTWTLDDAPYYAHPGTLRRASEVIDLWIEEFDAAYALTGYFMLVCHPRYAGRPSRILALERLIEHIKGHEGVWFARCDELASHSTSSETTPHHQAPETHDA